MTAVFRHEVKLYFTGMTAYVYSAFVLLITGIYMMVYNLNQGYANFEYTLYASSFIFIIVIPILSMRLIAEERKQKTDQLLYSLPITSGQIVIGKYLAALVVAVVPIIIMAIYPLILNKFGNVTLASAYGSLFAYFLTLASLLSIGMFISSITESQPLAAGISFAVMLLNYYMVSLASLTASSAYGSMVALVIIAVLIGVVVKILTKNDTLAMLLGFFLAIAIMITFLVKSSAFEGLFPNLLKNLSVYERFYEFVDGIFDLGHVVYFVSVIVFFLFLTVQSLEKRRYN